MCTSERMLQPAVPLLEQQCLLWACAVPLVLLCHGNASSGSELPFSACFGKGTVTLSVFDVSVSAWESNRIQLRKNTVRHRLV